MPSDASAGTTGPMEVERRVRIPRERLAGWLSRFAERHPGTGVAASADQVELTAADGARAKILVPFPPLLLPIDTGATSADPTPALPGHVLLDHVRRDRRIGVLLARKGGWAVGIFVGETLISSKVGSSYVQGTTKAGGWSQQRYARRRANQAQQSADRAAEVCVLLLLPERNELDALVTGGHRPAVEQVLTDPRLAPLRPLLTGDVLPTPDPRLRVLQDFAGQTLAVQIRLNAEAG